MASILLLILHLLEVPEGFLATILHDVVVFVLGESVDVVGTQEIERGCRATGDFGTIMGTIMQNSE